MINSKLYLQNSYSHLGKLMQNPQKYGALTAFVHVLLGIAMLIVAFMLIGMGLTDPEKFIDMVRNNPGLLILQDILKLLSAGTSAILVLALSQRIVPGRSPFIRSGPLFGFAAILLLLVNACLSLYATLFLARLEAGAVMNTAITLLGMLSIFLNGMWYIVENWVARREKRLPGPLAGLGLAIGFISLVPPLAIFVLILSLIWTVGLGIVWVRDA